MAEAEEVGKVVGKKFELDEDLKGSVVIGCYLAHSGAGLS